MTYYIEYDWPFMADLFRYAEYLNFTSTVHQRCCHQRLFTVNCQCYKAPWMKISDNQHSESTDSQQLESTNNANQQNIAEPPGYDCHSDLLFSSKHQLRLLSRRTTRKQRHGRSQQGLLDQLVMVGKFMFCLHLPWQNKLNSDPTPEKLPAKCSTSTSQQPNLCKHAKGKAFPQALTKRAASRQKELLLPGRRSYWHVQ